MNPDLHKQIADILKWQKDHAESDDKRFKEITAAIARLPQKDEIGKLMIDAIQDGGSWSFRFIVGLSVLIGAIVVILGGFKSLLAWVGIGFIK